MAPKLASVLASGVIIFTFHCASAMAGNRGPVLEYRNEKYGFSIKVPAEQFVAGTTRNPQIGGLWISRDNQARLLAVAAPNETGGSIKSYREFVMGNTYANAQFTYTPQRDNWFVLSGFMGDQVFYERITFACAGRYIYGWQLFYPTRQKSLFDPIVEEIHRNYRVGKGEDGNCDQS